MPWQVYSHYVPIRLHFLYHGNYGPIHTKTQSFHFVPYRYEQWNAEGLGSDRSSNRTVSFQKMERPESDTKSGIIHNRSVPI